MIAMSARVNVIPVIAKADTLTSREIATSKKLIMNDIREHNIQIFDFPYDEEDDEAREQCEHLRSLLPFTIIGAKDNRQRVYPWGTFNVDDTSLCDFVVLKSVLFGSHFEELRDITYNKHYEKYRTNKLRQDLGIKGPEALYSDLYE
jgi:cell division control protein 11